MGPSEGMEFGYVAKFAHCAVGLGGVPADFAFVSDLGADKFGKGANGEFLACAYVDVGVAYLGFTFGEVGKRHVEEDVYRSVGHVFAPKEFTKGCACAPELETVGVDAETGERVGDFRFRCCGCVKT